MDLISYKIGVDGGGTKTECILVDDRGAIVARQLAPGCNPSQVGPERARGILQSALQTLCLGHASGCVQSTHLYMAGNHAFWQETATGLTGFGEVKTDADSLPVLELATGGAPGLVLHAGTGSFIAARSTDGTIHYAGGLGWKFGDPGSGFDLGRRGLALALLELQSVALDSAAPVSALSAALREHTGLSDYSANSRFFYTDPAAHQQIAAFSPRVLALAAEACRPAQQVVADSVAELAQQANHVIHRLFTSSSLPVPCGISGHILTSAPGAEMLRSSAQQLHWPVTLRFITTAPIEGVRLLLTKK